MEPRHFAPKIPNDRITKQTPCLACLRGCPVLVCRAVSISGSSSGQQLLFFVLLALRAKALFFALLCRGAQNVATLPATELITYFPLSKWKGWGQSQARVEHGWNGRGVPSTLGT